MCCFAGNVREVSKTNIYATNLPGLDGPRQFLSYQMDFDAKDDFALILPIPTNATLPDVQFFEVAQGFFKTLDLLFPQDYTLSMTKGGGHSALRSILPIEKVGSYEVSFVPTAADFDRLDPRFTLPQAIWEGTEQETYGFVVAKLAHKGVLAGTLEPLSFAFNRRVDLGGGLFFPTFHIHDGEVQKAERFDHSLYFQTNYKFYPTPDFSKEFETTDSPRALMAVASHSGNMLAIVNPSPGSMHRKKIVGFKKNQDTFFEFSA